MSYFRTPFVFVVIATAAALSLAAYAGWIRRQQVSEYAVCYEPYDPPFVDYGDANVHKVELTVHWIDTETATDNGAEAWSEFIILPEQDTSICDIYVQPPVAMLGDPLMDALGHEVLHCLAGNFHAVDE
jgi:hypothetical protein